LLGGGTLAIDRTITADTVGSVGLVSKSNLASQMALKVSNSRSVAGFTLSSDVTLGNLTATDATLTFSGSYNGSMSRTVGLNLAIAPTWTGQHTFQQNGIGITSVDAISIRNNVAATAATPTQIAPRLKFTATGWNTTATSSTTYDFIQQLRPITGTSNNAQLYYSFGINGVQTDVAYMSTNGVLSLLGGFGNFTSANNSYLNTATTGIIITRNQADANAALTVSNQLGTGNIIRFQQNGSDRMTLDLNGLLTVTGNATFGTKLSVNTTSTIAALTIGNNIPFTTSGAFSQSGFGINQALMAYTSSAAGSTITNASVNSYGIATLVNANATTITNAFGNYFNLPTAGTNTTLTNRYSAGFNGDAYFVNVGDGPIVRSPNGTKWRITPSDTGTIVLTSIP